MTNHWADIANASLVIAWGANPTENHPACMAHVNRARFPKQYFSGDRANKKPARFIVIDPRKTRTALQADDYVRIRPGTDIALANGVMAYIIEKMRTDQTTYFADGTEIPAATKTEYWAYLNQSGNGTFFTDGDATHASTQVATVAGSSKYTDARFMLNGTDYDRGTVTTTGGTPLGTETNNLLISNFPKKAAACDAAGTVFSRMKQHLAAYSDTVVADICGCTVADIALVGDAIIQNSRCSSVSSNVTFTDRVVRLTDTAGVPDAVPMWGWNLSVASVKSLDGLTTYTAGTHYTVVAGTNSRSLGTLKRVAVAGGINAGDKVLVTYTVDTDQAPQAGYRATTILYAMGLTQHTYGAQNVKAMANLQSMMGNTGRAGGGINALRGIHNVQGSTDMGLLYGNIPGYSGNPGTQVTAVDGTDTNKAFGKYMDGLWGLPLSGTTGTTDFSGTVRSKMDNSYDDAYNTGAMQLQQRGFYNMTLKWFGGYSAATSATTLAARRAIVDKAYSLWPKGNGFNHIKMFRYMTHTDATRIQSLVVWGQNPAVTEPNQAKVREGLYNLDTLVCVDMFMNETAAVSRKCTGVTYLIPSAAHVEKAGAATNSGRTLQWRYKAVDPKGNSKDDNELLLRFAKALNDADCFAHIESVQGWASKAAYANLYGTPYGWTPGGAVAFTAAGSDTTGLTIDYATPGAWTGAGTTYAALNPATSTKVQGSEFVAEMVFREYTSSVSAGGTIWIYTEGYDTAKGMGRLYGAYSTWEVSNRSKSRDRQDPYGTLASHKWGYSWLVNRRVLYNNAEVVGDQSDFFMGPDSCVRLFSPKGQSAWAPTGTTIYNYSRWYRTILAPTSHVLADKPYLANGTAPAIHVEPGRFPAHTEPYETPRADDLGDLVWGYNSADSTAIQAAGPLNLIYDGTTIGKPSKYPLVLTTIRCVEHFQGGPITRNNWWNVEAEPEPWIELNNVDARLLGIADGDYVKVVTARTDGNTNAQGVVNALDNYGKGFVARVGVGIQSNQRVAQGVVAIPWHWGEQGLSTGSRANDLTIDAMDANTTIPEFKACLCRLEKM